jgi:site-specific recombinase XerC
MNGVETLVGVRMRNARLRNSPVQQWVETIPTYLRGATSATNALSDEADIAKVQEWLGHSNVSTTRFYFGARRNRRTARHSM